VATLPPLGNTAARTWWCRGHTAIAERLTAEEVGK
jgi:hypothetical protein